MIIDRVIDRVVLAELDKIEKVADYRIIVGLNLGVINSWD